jgi:formate hydrogenlyase transcriptional activator
MAQGGTVFLDEIGDVPLEVQPKLLRMLQEHEFERLGSNHTCRVDVRVIAATHKNLPQSVAGGQFRSDLFYRLSVFPIRVPALRERREDVALLVRAFMRKSCRQMGKSVERVSASDMAALTRWSWPGNVRELENFIERCVILTDGPELKVPVEEFSLLQPLESEALEDVERNHIVRVMQSARWVISGPNGAADRLKVKRTTLQSKLRKLGIRREEYRRTSAVSRDSTAQFVPPVKLQKSL